MSRRKRRSIAAIGSARKRDPLLAAAALAACLLTGCMSIAPPSEPPKLTQPPEVATEGFLTAYAEETVPLALPELRRTLEETPITDFLEPTDNLAPPVASEVLEGTWPEAGATRWLRLEDGHYVVERVLQNEPEFFRYQIYVFTNAAGRGVEQIVGELRFTPVEGGTRIEWSYNVKPRNFLARKVVSGRMEEIQQFIRGGLRGFAASVSDQR